MTARLVGAGERRGDAPGSGSGSNDPGSLPRMPAGPDGPPPTVPEVPDAALLEAARREPVRTDEVARARGLLDGSEWFRAERVAQALIDQTVEVLRFWGPSRRDDG